MARLLISKNKYSNNTVYQESENIVKVYEKELHMRNEISGIKFFERYPNIVVPKIFEEDLNNKVLKLEKFNAVEFLNTHLIYQIFTVETLLSIIQANLQTIDFKSSVSSVHIDEVLNISFDNGNHRLNKIYKDMSIYLLNNLNGAGVMHGDLSSNNILLDPPTDVVYLIDFQYFDSINGDPIWDLSHLVWTITKINNIAIKLSLLNYIRANVFAQLNDTLKNRLTAYIARKFILKAINSNSSSDIKSYIKFARMTLNKDSFKALHLYITRSSNSNSIVDFNSVHNVPRSIAQVDSHKFNLKVKKYYVNDSKFFKDTVYNAAILRGVPVIYMLNGILRNKASVVKILSKKINVKLYEYDIDSSYIRHILEFILSIILLQSLVFSEKKICIVDIWNILGNVLDKSVDISFDCEADEKTFYTNILHDFLMPSTTYFNRDDFATELGKCLCRKSNTKKQSILIIGVSTGGEAYSLNYHLRTDFNIVPDITATDNNELALKYASNALYNIQIIEHSNISDLFFKRRVKSVFRSNIKFMFLDITKGKLNQKFDVVVCRNVLKYIPNNNILQIALTNLFDMLRNDSILVLGKSNDGKDEDIDISRLKVKGVNIYKLNSYMYRIVKNCV